MSSKNLFCAEELTFSYNDNRVLHGINLRLEPGNFYGIVGPNGCGKTTFLDLLTGIKTPSSGTIKLNNQHVGKYSKRDLARKISLVPQDFDTGFGFTVEEVVMMGRHPHIDRFHSPSPVDYRRVDEALQAIGIDDLRHRYTNTLSGGQKQRVVVARSLAQDCHTLLLDEATSNLDIKYTLQIFNLVYELVKKQSRTVIAVAHNLNLAAAYCDFLIFMQEGRIIADGVSAKDLTPQLIREVFDVETKVIWDSYNQSNQVTFQYREPRTTL